MNIAIVLLAAGGSTRMRGGDKLLEEIDGEKLLHRSARVACESDAQSVVVVLGAREAERRAALSGLSLTTVVNADWAAGMGGSIAAGVKAAGDADAAIIMLADMPDITSHMLNRIMAACDPNTPDQIVRPRDGQGRWGNPVLFCDGHFAALSILNGDQGARELLMKSKTYITPVTLESHAITTDLDTPEAWADWRAGRSR